MGGCAPTGGIVSDARTTGKDCRSSPVKAGDLGPQVDRLERVDRTGLLDLVVHALLRTHHLHARHRRRFGRIGLLRNVRLIRLMRTHQGGAVVTSTGHGFCGLSRKTLLMILQDRCREVGVKLEFSRDLTDFVHPDRSGKRSPDYT